MDAAPRQLGYSRSLRLSTGGDKLGVAKMPDPRGTVPTLATVLALGASVCSAADAPKGKPNILLIVTDGTIVTTGPAALDRPGWTVKTA
jgi:hypothetical protein